LASALHSRLVIALLASVCNFILPNSAITPLSNGVDRVLQTRISPDLTVFTVSQGLILPTFRFKMKRPMNFSVTSLHWHNALQRIGMDLIQRSKIA
jgi:hypothetical protein